MLAASLLLALREIRRHILRSVLTILGIVIGVAAVITMVTVGNGVTASVAAQIASLGANSLIIYTSSSGRQVGSAAPRAFTSEDLAAMRFEVDGIDQVAGEVRSSVSTIANGFSWQTEVKGLTIAGLSIQAIGIKAGRVFTPDEDQGGKAVCLLGSTVSKNLFPGVDPIGDHVRINRISCIVVGVLLDRNQRGMDRDQNNVVIMPLRAVQRQILGSTDIQSVVLGASPSHNHGQIIYDLKRLLREQRHIASDQDDDFQIIDTKEVSETVARTLGVMTALVTAIASISLIVGGIGIANIMLVSVTERTREIGIRLAIGALPSEVRLQFLTESMILCLLGGMVGVVLALGLSIMITQLIGVSFTFNLMLNLGSLLFASILGIGFGYIPAQRAAALNPIDALRHE